MMSLMSQVWFFVLSHWAFSYALGTRERNGQSAKVVERFQRRSQPSSPNAETEVCSAGRELPAAVNSMLWEDFGGGRRFFSCSHAWLTGGACLKNWLPGPINSHFQSLFS